MFDSPTAQDINAGLLFYIRTKNNPQSLRASDTSLRTSNEAFRAANEPIRTFGPPARSVSDPSMRTANSSIRTSTSGDMGGESGFFGTMRGIEAKYHEIRGILIARNTLANYLYEYSVDPEQAKLPALIRDSFTCNHCYVSEACMSYHKVAKRREKEAKNYYCKEVNWQLT
jgi:hypothetical protein